MDYCSFCNTGIAPAQAEGTKKLYGKPVCTKEECTTKARKEADEAAELLMTPRDRVIAYLHRNNFVEQGTAKGLFIQDGATQIAVDLTGITPRIGSLINDEIIEEGHGISRIDDIKRDIEGILKSKNGAVRKKNPAPKTEEGAETNTVITESVSPELEPKPKPPLGDIKKLPQSVDLIELIRAYVGNDVLEVFGDTGTGKSKFGLEVARQAIAAGKKVFYLDTERNLTNADIESLKGCQYKYTPIIDEIDQITRKLPVVDVVIVDSIGFPVLTSYARLSVKQKGDALLKLIAIFGDLKVWAYKNNGIAIVTNQPESEFNKEPGHVLRPFGDKSQFAAKEIWKTEIAQRNQNSTKISITAFRSRNVGHGTKIATMEVTDKGVEIKEVVA